MSITEDSITKIRSLLMAIGENDQAYRTAIHILAQLDAGDVTMSGVQLQLHFGDTQVPIPVPDQAVLHDHVVYAINHLGNGIVRLWNELADTTDNVRQHCNNAVSAANAQPAAPYITPSVPVPVQQPVAVQRTPERPRVNIHVGGSPTTPVT